MKFFYEAIFKKITKKTAISKAGGPPKAGSTCLKFLEFVELMQDEIDRFKNLNWASSKS